MSQMRLFKMMLSLFFASSICSAVIPVFHQYKKIPSKNGILEYDARLAATGINLVQCAAKCFADVTCRALFHGSTDSKCYHRESATSLEPGYPACGYTYYYVTGRTSAAEEPTFTPPEFSRSTYHPYPSTLSTTAATASYSCSKPGAVYVQQLGTCLYKDPSFIFSWSLASSKCGQVGGALIELETMTKYNVVNAFLKNSSSGISTNYGFWTGGTSSIGYGYKWSSGVTLATGMWESGEPSVEEQCVAMQKPGYELSSQRCVKTLDMLCEIEPVSK